ncbi:hypothetical protein D3C87_1711860 [compost metagenome]
MLGRFRYGIECILIASGGIDLVPDMHDPVLPEILFIRLAALVQPLPFHHQHRADAHRRRFARAFEIDHRRNPCRPFHFGKLVDLALAAHDLGGRQEGGLGKKTIRLFQCKLAEGRQPVDILLRRLPGECLGNSIIVSFKAECRRLQF